MLDLGEKNLDSKIRGYVIIMVIKYRRLNVMTTKEVHIKITVRSDADCDFITIADVL